MPTVVNGIGTWYYGKKRIHTIKDTCEFCNHHTDLSSYDTTLFFVVVFVPIIPLQQYRVLRNCPVCSKHRIISLKKWEAAKAAESNEVLEALSANPDNRDAIMRAIQFSMVYQDEPLFNQTVRALASGRTDDAQIQALLGHGYSYFSRWSEAEEAFRNLIAIEDTEDNRESLAWCLLKRDCPEDAKPWLQHILDNRKAEAAGLVYHLVNGHQSQGLHDEALAIMDERDEAFPQFVELKEYKTQRKNSTKNRGTNKRIRSAIVSETNTGYRDGKGASWPRWVAASVFLGAIALYLGSAFWIGENRKVFLVNGTGKAYDVTVAGERHTLQARSYKPVRIPEGDVAVAFENQPTLQPVTAHIETSFWGRPFSGRTFVINPDESAVIVEEETYYAKANPKQSQAPTIGFGKPFYEMSGVDYEFEEFPQTLQVKGSGEIRKTRVGLAPVLAPEFRLIQLMMMEPHRQIEMGKKLLSLDANDTMVLHWMSTRLPPAEAVQLLESRLDDRPILIEWHRAYQSLKEKQEPNTDLRPRYRKLVADENSQPDALYLLARCEPDFEAAEKLFRQAATAKSPSGHACYALGNQAASRGEFDLAVEWFDKAWALPVDKTIIGMARQMALLAKQDFDSLIRVLQADAMMPGRRGMSNAKIMSIHAIRGDQVQMAQARSQALLDYEPTQRTEGARYLDGLIACGRNDAPGYIKANSTTPSFETAFLSGQLAEAAKFADSQFGSMGILHGLIYLEANRAGNKALAKTQWDALIKQLQEGPREEKRFAELLLKEEPIDTDLARKLTLDPANKRVLLTVLAQRQPKASAELLVLAKKLDFQHDAISLCLAKVWGKR